MRINILKEAQTYAYRIYIKLDNYTLDNAKKIFGKYFDIVKLYYEEYRMKDKLDDENLQKNLYGKAASLYMIRMQDIAIKYKAAFSLKDGKLGSWTDVENYNKELKVTEAELNKTFSAYDNKFRILFNKYCKLQVNQKLLFEQMATKGSDYNQTLALFYKTQGDINDVKSQMFDRIKELVNVE